MRFGLLGAVQVIDDQGAEKRVSAAKHRILLAALLLNANRPVPRDALVDTLWAREPPPNAAAALRTYYFRLRRVLGQAGERLGSTPASLMITIRSPAEFDLLQAEDLHTRARAAVRAAQWQQAATLLQDAEALWRGRPLADVPSDVLSQRDVPRLEELRIAVTGLRIDAELGLGRAGKLVGELRALAAEHPLRENIHAQLMTALYQSQRRSEALAAYGDARRVLRDQLGADPSAQLRELHARILAADPALTVEAAPVRAADPPAAESARPPADPPAVPRQLPADTRMFVGRGEELARLRELAAEAARGETGGTVLVSAIDGMAGVGKTALALRAAHRLADLFPDGQLYMDLRGHARNQAPRRPGEVLGALLRTLAVPAQQIPEDVDERAALYRQRLAGTSTLVVLDDAESEAQIKPLLPGARGCLVIVTSRSRLKSLDDAESLALDVLSAREAIALLRGVAGQGRVADGDPLAGEIADLCGRLPIALRVAAALLRARPSWGLGYLAELLRDRVRRVDRLRDAQRDLTELFELSYSQLDAPGRRMFALLGLAPGPHIGVRAAAGLAAVGLDAARRLLEDLVDRNLVSAPSPERYQFHELLRLYAAGLAEQVLTAEEREAAVRRLVAFYVHTSYAADRHMGIAREPLSLPAPPPGALPRTVSGAAEATAWFIEERECLPLIQRLAAESGLDESAWQIAWNLHVFHQRQGMQHEQLATWQCAFEAAERLADPGLAVTALRGLGLAHARVGHHAEGIAYLRRGLAVAESAGDLSGQAHTHHALCLLWDQRDEAEQVIAHAERALALFRRTGVEHDQVNEADALSALAWYRARAGEYPEARELAEQARTLFLRHGHRDGEASVIDTLALIAHRTGDSAQALERYHQALALFREIGNAYQEVETLEHLGDVYRSLGRPEQARHHWNLALASYRAQHRSAAAERIQRKLSPLSGADADAGAG